MNYRNAINQLLTVHSSSTFTVRQLPFSGRIVASQAYGHTTITPAGSGHVEHLYHHLQCEVWKENMFARQAELNANGIDAEAWFPASTELMVAALQ